MERKHSVLCIPIRYIATNKEERPFLLEMKPEDTFSDIQSKILDCYRLPVARQLFYCGDKCLNATYTPETKLSEIKEMQNMSKAQAIFVYDINSMKQNVNTAISTTSPESAIGLMSPGTLSMNANNLLNNSKGGPLYIKCGKQPAHDPLNIEDHISEFTFKQKCDKCGNMRDVDHGGLSTSYFTMISKRMTRCSSCNTMTTMGVALLCNRSGCDNCITSEDSVLWHITRTRTDKSLVVKFSACDHFIPLKSKPRSPGDQLEFRNDFETLLITNLSGIIVENIGSEKQCHGDYVFQCPRCKGNKFSYAAFNTVRVVDHNLRDNLRVIVAQKRMNTNTPISTLQLNLYENECRGFVSNPFRCPTCCRNIESNVVQQNPTTHTSCLHPKCPKFCIFCFRTEKVLGKTEGTISENDLFSHNVDSALNGSRCPLFLETYPLFSSRDLLVSFQEFLYWRTVGLIYGYALNARILDVITQIESLKCFTKSFAIWEKLFEIRDRIVLPIPASCVISMEQSMTQTRYRIYRM